MSTTTKPAYSFGTSKFEEAIKNLTSTKPIDPAQEIKNFNSIVKERGYGYFSQQSWKDWIDTYAKISQPEIYKQADEDTKQFMYAIQTPGHPEHQQNRLLFTSNFQAKEHLVKEFFLHARKYEAGEFFRPSEDLSHQQRAMGSVRIENAHQQFEQKTMKDLMAAKWEALGYLHDAEYRQRFIDTYCVAISK